MKRNIKQLIAISYAYTQKEQKQADELVEKLAKLGFKVEESKYPATTIKRCRNIMIAKNIK